MIVCMMLWSSAHNIMYVYQNTVELYWLYNYLYIYKILFFFKRKYMCIYEILE